MGEARGLEARLRAVEREADAIGVGMTLSRDRAGIHVDELWRDPAVPRRAGGVALAMACALADREGLPTRLVCVSLDEGLLGLYRRHGFSEVDAGGDPDDGDDADVVMARPVGGVSR